MRFVLLISLTAIVSKCRFATQPTEGTPVFRESTMTFRRSIVRIGSIRSMELDVMIYPTAGLELDRPQFCPQPSPANQSSHRLVNTIPLKRLVLRYPRVDKTSRYGLVLLVNSATNETAERNEIRRQWANKDQSRMQKSGKSLVIFVVGRSTKLEEESKMFGDLLQFDIEDTYRNLVYKIEAGLRWIKEKVDSEFVAKVDSDTVVHIDRLYRVLSGYERELSDNWIACYIFPDSKPVRDTCSPWYLSEEDYPPDYFPPYCNGPGYAMNRKLFEMIVKRMKKHKVFEVEDAFITGIVANDVGDITMIQDVAAPEYADVMNCDMNGPTVSILSTHHQHGGTKPNLTAAWNWLKNADCHDVWQYGSTMLPVRIGSSTRLL